MKTQESRQRGSQANPACVYVSNLDHSCSNKKIESDLHQIFSKYGQISSINVMRNIKYKKLFAFVIFADPKNAEDAIENLHNTYFGDSKIKVEIQKGRSQNNAIAVTCYRCQKVGHFAKDCTEQVQRRERRVREKSKQKERSHKKRRSAEKKKRYSSSSSSSASSSSSRRRDRSRNRSASSSSSSSSSR